VDTQEAGIRSSTLDRHAFERTLTLCATEGLIARTDPPAVLYIFDPAFPFNFAVSLASSVHVHTKVTDVKTIDGMSLAVAGGEVERRSPGYVKYRFPGGINMIFSSFPIAEEDIVDPEVTSRLPYVDHLGVDLRDTVHVLEAYRRVPDTARSSGWEYRFQGGPVYGCHAEVAEKHWVYPPMGPHDWRRPTEFPLGPLTLHDDYMGCDLRPIDPRHPMAERVISRTGPDCSNNCSCQ
jgi:hypothetical protein